MKTKTIVTISMLLASAMAASAQNQDKTTVKSDTLAIIRTITESNNVKDTIYYMQKIKNGAVSGMEKIENGVTSGYKSIENGVVNGYMKVQDGVVAGWTKVENKMVETLFKRDGETTEDAKERLRKNAEEAIITKKSNK